MEKIILETERLCLREMNMNDFEALYAVLGDPEIMRHYPYKRNIPMKQTRSRTYR